MRRSGFGQVEVGGAGDLEVGEVLVGLALLGLGDAQDSLGKRAARHGGEVGVTLALEVHRAGDERLGHGLHGHARLVADRGQLDAFFAGGFLDVAADGGGQSEGRGDSEMGGHTPPGLSTRRDRGARFAIS